MPTGNGEKHQNISLSVFQFSIHLLIMKYVFNIECANIMKVPILNCTNMSFSLSHYMLMLQILWGIDTLSRELGISVKIVFLENGYPKRKESDTLVSKFLPFRAPF